MPFTVKVTLLLVNSIGYLQDRILRLPLYLSVTVMGISMPLPVVGVWSLFVAANYLRSPYGPIAVWVLTFSLIATAATADYVRSHRS